jgi:transposase
VLGINDIRSGPPLGVPKSQPIRTIAPPADVKAGHIAAKLEISNRSAEINTDWRQVWDELGLLRPSSFQRERSNKLDAEYAQELLTNIRQGDEAGDLRNPSKPNIFGRHAYEDYMRRSKVDVVIDIAPKSRVKFDIRVHPPEIEVQTRPIAGTK